MISPPELVTEYAAAKLRHGLPCGQLAPVLPSLPPPETKVRAALAKAAEVSATVMTLATKAVRAAVLTLIFPSLQGATARCADPPVPPRAARRYWNAKP